MATATAIPDFQTLPNVARELGVGAHRLERLIVTGKLQPTKRLGRVRLFDDDTVKRAAKLLGVDRLVGKAG